MAISPEFLNDLSWCLFFILVILFVVEVAKNG